MRIIALSGRAGAGKDTFADRLVEKHGFMKRGFADPLYEEVAEAFQVPIAWLRDRSRKEKPQPELRLANSGNKEFLLYLPRDHRRNVTEPRSPRQILQWWGTDYRRMQDDSYWIGQMERFHEHWDSYMKKWEGSEAPGPVGIAIPDCRFENEAQWVVDNKGMVIEIVRDTPGVAPHVSEKPLPRRFINSTVNNTRDLTWLRFCADYVGHGPNW